MVSRLYNKTGWRFSLRSISTAQPGVKPMAVMRLKNLPPPSMDTTLPVMPCSILLKVTIFASYG
jgi:hypothetical protein